MFEKLLIVYMAGSVVSLAKSIHFFFTMKKLPPEIAKNFLSSRMIRYISLKPIMWPWYFVTEKSPLARISETFFKNYGDEGCMYFGTSGLRNFLKDVVLGKNRYEGWTLERFVWPISTESEAYKAEQDLGTKYASFVLAKKKDRFLLGVMSSDDKREHPTSRYSLDLCAQYTDREQVLERLRYFNPEKAKLFKF